MWWVMLVASIVAIYVYVTWHYGHWRGKGVPYVEPTFGFGSILPVLTGKTSMGLLYKDLYWHFSGQPFGGFFRFRTPALVIRDPEVIKTVLVKDFQSFHANDFPVNEKIDPVLGKNPFILTGDRWRVVRSQLSPGFSSGKVKGLFAQMLAVCEDMVAYVRSNPDSLSHDGVEAKGLMVRYTMDVVATCVFGLRGTCFTDEDAEFRRIGASIISPGFWRGILQTAIFLLPQVTNLFKLRFISSEVEKFFRRIAEEIATYREQNNIRRNDFMQLLLDLRAKGEGVTGKKGLIGTKDYQYTIDDVAAQSVMFFTDGFETSSTVLAYSLYELAYNIDIQEKLRDQIDALMDKNGGKLEYDALQDFTLLNNVIYEAMRKHPPVLFMNRLCTKTIEIPRPDGRNVRIEAGTSIVIPVFALHNDPQYYPEPERFDPDRFLEERMTAPKYTYLPFGEGPRICMGTRFAFAQMRAGLASLVANFEIRPARRMTAPLKPDPSVFLMAPLGGIWLNFIPRNDK